MPLRHRARRRRARWGSAPSSRATRPDRAKRTAAVINGCGTPVATASPRMMSRLQSCVATDREILLHPDVGEGRNYMLRRGRCASPRCVAVPTSHRFSERVAEELNRVCGTPLVSQIP